MAEDPAPQGGLLASRLDRLFRTVHPADRGPYTPAEVAAAINAAAGENIISATYVWQMRTGRRDNPTYKHVIALSRCYAACADVRRCDGFSPDPVRAQLPPPGPPLRPARQTSGDPRFERAAA